MTHTYTHIFQTDHRLHLEIFPSVSSIHFQFTWHPELKTKSELKEMESEYLVWCNYWMQDSFEPCAFRELFNHSCKMELEMRMQQLTILGLK